MGIYNVPDLSGRRFGRLLVKEITKKNERGNWWLCLCDCGEKIEVRTGSLLSKNNRSCGCAAKDYIRKKTKLKCPHKNRKHHSFGLCSMCYRKIPKNAAKDRAQSKKWRIRLKKKLGSSGYTRYLFVKHLKVVYRLTLKEYEELKIRQNYKCPCGRKLIKKFRPSVDHDHFCCPKNKSCGNCVRGILCSRCNFVLGLLENDIKLIPSYLLVYLKQGFFKK